jgi:hypothetical protein
MPADISIEFTDEQRVQFMFMYGPHGPSFRVLSQGQLDRFRWSARLLGRVRSPGSSTGEDAGQD